VATVAAGPLDGLLVADLSRVLAGPLCTMTLGDLGADVIKVERPDGGDDTRKWGPPYDADGVATYYLGLNRNKRSIALDFKDAADLALVCELCARADVVVSSFRPGTLARFGLDHDTLAAADPRVISCEVSAFGDDPRAAHLAGYDLLLQAMGGLMSVTGEQGGRPLKVGAALVDMISGLSATIGVLAALAARERTGRGQRVATSLMENALTALLNQASGYLGAGVVPGPMGTRHPSLAPYETLPAADGELCLAIGNDAMFVRFCAAVGRADIAADARFCSNSARLGHRAELEAELGALLAARSVDAWVALLTEAGVPAGAVNDVAGAFALAESLGLAPVDETGGVRTVRPPLRFSDTPASVRLPPPALGAHDAELRAWLSRPPRAPGGSSSAA
jgi:crotonobetainyl-CoA:carnitine CoA-transferase CaiB-like acyl-CoA transferase